MLSREPALLWQQLHNRLQWEVSPAVAALLAADRERRRGGPPWIRQRSGTWESPALHRLLPTAGATYVPGDCAFSPDSGLLATTGRCGTVRLWDVRTGDLWSTLDRGRPAYCCEFSDDGTLLAAGYLDGLVVWRVDDGADLRHLSPSKPRQVLRAIDGERRAAALDGSMSVWHGSLLERVPACAFAPGARVLAVGTEFGRIALVDVRSWNETALLDGHEGPVTGCVFHPGGDLLATAATDATVRIWEPRGRHRRWRCGLSLRLASPVTSLAFSPDGALLVALEGRGPDQVTVFATRTDRVLRTYPAGTGAQTCAVDPSGTLLATAGDEVLLQRLSQDPTSAPAHLQAATPTASACAFSPDGRYLATAGDEQVALWDLRLTAAANGHRASPEPLEWPEPSPGRADGDVLSPDGELAATCDGRGVTVRGLSTGVAQHTVVHPTTTRRSGPDATWRNELVLTPGIARCFFSPHGDLLFTVGAEDDLVCAWYARSGDLVYQAHCPGLGRTVLSPDGRVLATCGSGPDVILWDASNGAVLRELTGAGTVECFSPDSRLMATVTADAVEVWSVATGTRVARLPAPDPVDDLAFHPTLPALRGRLHGLGPSRPGVLEVELVEVGYDIGPT